MVAKTEQELADYLKSGESGGVTRLPTGEFAVPFCININVGKHPTKEQVEQALNELFVRSAKLLEITSRETTTYKDAMSRASDWVDTKNSILGMLGGRND